MCWFIHFQVVLQKDTPAARAQIAALPENCTQPAGTFPEFTLPDGICGCAFVRRDAAGRAGTGIVDESVAALRHYLAQPPVKRVDVWWHWESDEPAARPALEESISLEDFLHRNAADQFAPGTCYRITDLSRFRHG